MFSEDAVIKVEGVGKCFSIYDRPRDRLKQFVMPRIRALTGQTQISYGRKFWALRDVSFEVGQGKAVGIIGGNGSGKSTLLQIIAGTMTPTYGNVVTQGRTAALLELGSGFNPEFTGRENVYLNAGLLGLTLAQINDKFDTIAGFADIGEHLEQPVKTYSSGMMMRLAFAVQMAVEAQILIIDEALAVGDARFQLKCFRRLEEIKAQGTTILFVSHAIELVRSFCDFGLVLENGNAIYWGDAKTATVKYLASVFPDQTQPKDASGASNVSSPDHAEADNAEGCLTIRPDQTGVHTFGVGGATLDWLKIYGLEPPNMVMGGRDIRIRCRFSWNIDFVNALIKADGYEPNIAIGIALADKKGNYIFGCNGYDSGLFIDSTKDGTAIVQLSLNMPHLAEGDYFYTVAISVGNLSHHVQLKWYDYLVQLQYLKRDKNVFGILGVNYTMESIDNVS